MNIEITYNVELVFNGGKIVLQDGHEFAGGSTVTLLYSNRYALPLLTQEGTAGYYWICDETGKRYDIDAELYKECTKAEKITLRAVWTGDCVIKHTLNGIAINPGEEKLHAETIGLIEFSNARSTCKDKGSGYFWCELCGKMFAVDTYRDHTPDEDTRETFNEIEGGIVVTYVSYECLDCGETITEKV